MINLKNLFFVFLIFNFAICVNEVNNVINSFDPNNGYATICRNNIGQINFFGEWDDYENIPNSLKFTLTFKDGNKLSCSFSKNKPAVIEYPDSHESLTIDFEKQFMDDRHEYELKEYNSTKGHFSCKNSSLYICSNLLLIFVMIFILFL